MTRKEAINHLKDLATAIQLMPNSLKGQAMKMAINSLKVDEMYQLEMEDADAFVSVSVIEDIKAEIEHMDRHKDKFTSMYTRPKW